MTQALVILRLVIGLTFVAAASGKVPDLRRFRRVIDSYRLLPRWAVTPTALGLPLCEFCIGFLLALGWHTCAAAVAASLLLLSFVSAASLNLRRRSAIECGCGLWGESEPLGWHMVARDLLLTVLTLAVAFGPVGATRGLLGYSPVQDSLALVITAGLILLMSALLRSTRRLRATLRKIASAEFGW